ncbi:MAG: outer membrane beta-barrel protein [Candidatus Cryptobacteroides sp.]
MNHHSKHILAAAGIFLTLALCPLDAQDSLKVSKRREKASAGDFSPEYLDTVQLKKVFILNDYSTIGVEYGAAANMTLFTPTKKQSYLLSPSTVGVYYTRYCKMFGYLPYFGMKVGIRYTTEGYKFKEDKETHVVPSVEGATSARIRIIDVPFMAVFHADSDHFSGFANIGIYGGYRTSIERFGNYLDESVRNSFMDYDRRFDYGLCGGVGLALVFAPFEFQLNLSVRYAWGSLYDYDYASPYYYRYAYPLDFTLTGGLYFHLTKRTGRSKAQIRREAIDRVKHPELYEESDSDNW